MFTKQDLSPGVMKYIKKAEKLINERREYWKRMKKVKFDTIAVHGVYSIEEAYNKNQGAVIEPLYLSSSQCFKDSEELEAALAYKIPAWIYTRIANPTIYYLEQTFALMETYGTDLEASACATSSGLSAIFLATEPFLIKKTKKSDEKINFVATIQCYGGTYQLFNLRRMEERGIEVRWVMDSTNLNEWEEKIDENTRFLYGEMPSNPQLGIFDIEEVAKLAHKYEIPLIVDATIATPALLRPLTHGADIVVHSLTKSATASGYVIGGIIVARKNITTNIDNQEMRENFSDWLKLWPFRDYGPSLSPINAIFTLAEIKTLRIKMDHFSQSSMKVARFLESHPKVEKVDYLGLPSHPLHKLAKKYLTLVDSEDEKGNPINRYGHLMSFNVAGSAEDTRKVYDNLKLIFRATDLGRIKSIATIPAISTHQQQGEEARKAAKIPPQMIRLCIGGENPEDIIEDLGQALKLIK
ncbi:aminotransferase class I/II-fold pyridoxal phosphate-dependent enzyme [Candidatus Aminicenantes bacterium AH-873-B07]|jgi:O-acetylhomoserine/O-acetylserine sulfhydrylase-like pyridoxal-dependent enzyme|nr:aminotransferase class I/II-fold pyridoxal phosphate-dependent enzyme [Candidatus Aminicenantes bacterium AH-873-B07]